MSRHLARHGWLPARQRTFVHRSIIGESRVRNLGHDFAVLQHAQRVAGRYRAYLDCVESPFFEDAEDFTLTSFLRDEQHAFLRFAEHDLVGSHARFTLGHAVEFDFDADAAAAAHFAGGTGEAGSAHILNPDDRTRLHGLEAGFEQEFFEERVTDLHIRALGFRGFAEFLARHGRAVDAVAPGLCANVDYRISLASRLRVKNFVLSHQAQRKGVDQRITRVAGLELGFAAQVGHSETVSVRSDAADHALEDGMILVEF